MGGMPGTVRGEMTKWPPAAAQPQVGSLYYRSAQILIPQPYIAFCDNPSKQIFHREVTIKYSCFSC